MANVVYPLYRQALLTGGSLDLITDQVDVVLVKGTYTYSSAHTNYTTSVLAHVIGGPMALTSKTATTPRVGVFDAADVTFSAVPDGAAGTAVIGYHFSSGTLIFYIDSGTNLPVTPPTGGGDITIVWPDTLNRIFAIGSDS